MILRWITLAPVQAAVYTRLSRGQLLDTLVAAFVVVAHIVVDLVYTLLDPRAGSPEAR